MEKLGLNEIRKLYLDYFNSKSHFVQKSYPLVPQDDDTIMFVVAGMVPFKDYFSGAKTPPSTRMATSQKCIRTNDIDNVGKTARHGSFFEMLGNFSFGDYFKKDAIHYAWDFITNYLKIDKDKLWVSIYEEDDEAFEIWTKQENVSEDRIIRMGKADNFWEMGTGTGPCGPCSEIYFDRGEQYNLFEGECKPGSDGDRFIEFWNLVFTQFDKLENGTLMPLQKKNIDTGMGLERIACLMQGVDSIFEIDVFKKIIEKIEEVSKKKYKQNEKDDISIRIIADHMRSVTFLITDGVLPNNEGRGYVLRRLLRRASRNGRLLGIKENFLSKVADVIIDEFKEAYPELAEKSNYTKQIINIEEEKFSKTIDDGLEILEKYIIELEKNDRNILDGDIAFKLYDTYGFPLDLTKEILSERKMSVDEEEFIKNMQEQKERARASRNKGTVISQDLSIKLNEYNVEFLGYETLQSISKVIAIIRDGEFVEFASEDEEVLVIFDKSPFYAENGGQIGDTGIVFSDTVQAEVLDSKKLPNSSTSSIIKIKLGTLKLGDEVKLEVDEKRRLSIKRNHTATHLLHKALRVVLGENAKQAGSYVGDDRLRFDFTHFKSLTEEEIKSVETLVNNAIYEEYPVKVLNMKMEDAIKTGADHFFNDKYNQDVRIIRIGNCTGDVNDENLSKNYFSVEFCGGTHCKNAVEIGAFKIISESAIASGVRRIEAITGRELSKYLDSNSDMIKNITSKLKISSDDLLTKLDVIVEENTNLRKELNILKALNLKNMKKNIIDSKILNNGNYIIKYVFENEDINLLKDLMNEIANEEQDSLVIVFVNKSIDKANFLVKLNEKALENGKTASAIVKELSAICGGNGGGKKDFAQAGIKDLNKIDDALALL